jgi:tryptophan synthase alpha subunit
VNRIETVFAKTKKENRAALIPFIMGCDPSRETTLSLLEKLPQAGADIVEIGMAFSDPMADGKSIQAAGLRALAAGANVGGVLAIVKEFRKKTTKRRSSSWAISTQSTATAASDSAKTPMLRVSMVLLLSICRRRKKPS